MVRRTRTEIRTAPPDGVWRSALTTRFPRPPAIRTGSTDVGTGSPSSAVSATPASRAAAAWDAATSAISRRTSVSSRWSGSAPASASESVRRSSSSRSITRVSSNRGEVGIVARVDAVEHGLVLPAMTCRACAARGDVGEQGLAVGPRAVQPLRHRVERGGQPPDGPRALDLHAHPRLAVGESLRGARDGRERPDGTAEHGPDDDDRHEEDGDHREGGRCGRAGAGGDDPEDRRGGPGRDDGHEATNRTRRQQGAPENPRSGEAPPLPSPPRRRPRRRGPAARAARGRRRRHGAGSRACTPPRGP